MKKLAIENADHLAYYYVQKDLPLRPNQRQEFKKNIKLFLNQNKHIVRNDILPLLHSLNLDNLEEIEKEYQQFEFIYLKIARMVSDVLSRELVKLDQEQQKEFFNELKHENDVIRKKIKIDPFQKVEERFEKLVGPSNLTQKKIIIEYSEYMKERSQDRLVRREKLHQKFKELYEQKVSEEAKKSLFQEAFEFYQKESLSGNRNLEILKKVLPLLTKEQKIHLKKHLMNAEDLFKYYLTVEY